MASSDVWHVLGLVVSHKTLQCAPNTEIQGGQFWTLCKPVQDKDIVVF